MKRLGGTTATIAAVIALAGCGGRGSTTTVTVATPAAVAAPAGVTTSGEETAAATDATVADPGAPVAHLSGSRPLDVSFPPDFDANSWTARIVARRPLTKAEEAVLRRLVNAWFDVGNVGGYDTAVPGGQPLSYLEVRLSRDRRTLAVNVDAGDPSLDALSTLVRMLEGVREVEGVPLLRVTFD